MRLLAFAAFLLLVSSVYPAFVYGDIYSSNLEKINKTLVKVEGEFSYQVVTDKANYSIFLPEGEYRISASSFNEQGDLVLYTEENIKVGSEDQKVDLVLSHVSTFDQLIIVALVFLIIIVFIWSNHFWYPGKKKPAEAIKPKKQELDADAKRVLKVLESLEGRATQKEVLEATKFSNSKLSLILGELESIGKIRKFKRGRGNIIRKI